MDIELGGVGAKAPEKTGAVQKLRRFGCKSGQRKITNRDDQSMIKVKRRLGKIGH